MILDIRKLCKQYKRGNETFNAVDHVDLELSRGEFACIIGHSGSGKSTLFNMIASLLKATEGKILIDGIEITCAGQKELSSFRASKIGYVMQGQNLLSNFNIFQNILLPGYLLGNENELREKGLELMEQVGLIHKKDAYPAELSGGELRRIAIIRSLINSPNIIIADEPTGGLDPDNSELIMNLLKDISKKGTTVLISTHNMSCLKYTDRIYKMKQGYLYKYNHVDCD